MQPVLGWKQSAQKDLLTQFTPSGRSILDYKQPAAAAFCLSLPPKVVWAEYGRLRSALIHTHTRHAGNAAIEWEREIVVIFNLGVARDPFLPI